MTQTRNHPLTFEFRRPDATGEFPLYQPKTIGDVDEMARLALGATLVLPAVAPPPVPRRSVPTVYTPALSVPVYPPRPPGYLGTHRHADDMPKPVKPARWPWLLLSIGAVLVSHAAVAGLTVLAVAR